MEFVPPAEALPALTWLPPSEASYGCASLMSRSTSSRSTFGPDNLRPANRFQNDLHRAAR